MSLTSYDPSLSTRAAAMPPRLVSFDEIDSTLARLLTSQNGIDRLVNSQVDAFSNATNLSGVSSLPIQTLGQDPQPPLTAGPFSQICIKTGYIANSDVVVSKIAAGGGDETGNSGAVFVLDQRTLRLSAILCDEGLLTEVRTAVACALASRSAVLRYKHYHPEWDINQIKKIGFVGGGVQAVWQLRFLALTIFAAPSDQNSTLPIVIVKTQSRESAEAFITKMSQSTFPSDHLWKFEHYDGTSEGKRFSECNLIHTAVPSRSPVIFFSDLDPSPSSFLHITACGADSTGKCELDPKIISSHAGILLCDSKTQSMERGEFQVQRKLCIDDNALIEIGGKGVISESGMLVVPKEKRFISIFDTSGLAQQDLEISKVLFESL